jgi:predicted O-methyltransferase YrrM
MAGELAWLIGLAKETGARSYLEVGARYGDTFYDVVRAMPENSLGVCVDLPGEAWGTKGSESSLASACKELVDMGYHIRQIMGDSRSPAVIRMVATAGSYDLALIDGDHTYDGVKADWLNYQPFCKVMCFHDIVGHGQRHDANTYVEVPRFWAELEGAGYKTREVIAENSTMGIGAVWTR